MANRVSLILLNENNQNIETDLNTVTSDHKNSIKTLQISRYMITELQANVLYEFGNVIDLNLSKNLTLNLENGIFHNLIRLQFLNLSDNMLSVIDSSLFITNIALKVILLQNNLLTSINKMAFLPLENLKILDLNYNLIEELSEFCLMCGHLTELYLNNNQINRVAFTAFYQIPNLTHLDLHNNIITCFRSEYFVKSSKLQHLYLNNNQIRTLNSDTFKNLTELKTLNLGQNTFTNVIDKDLFLNQNQLNQLDLSDCKISIVQGDAFVGCQTLMKLNLTVCNDFRISSIKKLQSLTKFELNYKSETEINLSKSFWSYFRNKTNLVDLKLVFRKADFIDIRKMWHLIHLESLHIECIEPSQLVSNQIDFSSQFYKMPKLKVLTLKKLNYFTVDCKYRIFPTKNLIDLNLTGLKNHIISDIFKNFQILKNLNLSYSGITYIGDNVFTNLHYLENLDLKYSKLKSITAKLFETNTLLKLIDCSNCCITRIDDYSFRNLFNLELLDLRHNSLRDVSLLAFSGIRQETVIYTDSGL